MNNITKEDIANFINSEFGLTRKDCNNFVRDMLDFIVQIEEIIILSSLGFFVIRFPLLKIFSEINFPSLLYFLWNPS